MVSKCRNTASSSVFEVHEARDSGRISAIKSTASAPSSVAPPYSALAEENALLREQLKAMQRQVDWFRKQLFGPRSERQVYDLPMQGSLFSPQEAPASEKPPEDEKRTVKAYQRGTGKKQRDDDCLNDTGLRFTADVPVEVIEHLPSELSGPDADQYDVLGI